MKKLIAAFVLLTLVTMLVVACGGSSTSSGGGGGGTVHMDEQHFLPPSVTISKGSNLTLVDDTATVHIIANGSWVNGNAQPMQENGAPVVNNLQFNGYDTHTIGPFNTAGTFHLYCIIHQNMNLTVAVQ